MYLLPVVALAAIFAIGLSVLAVQRVGPPYYSGLLYPIAFSLLLTGWVRVDRRTHSFSAPFEFDAFVYFAWPIFVPYYLFRTRGWKGLIFGVGICGLSVAPMIVAVIVAGIVATILSQ